MKCKKWIQNHYISLENKVILITGGNSGIGFESAKVFCYYQAKVILACRDKNKANLAIEKIKKEIPNANLVFEEYHQDSFVSIKEFANRIKKNYQIDIMVFNAGVYYPRDGVNTTDGYELTFGTNYLGLYSLFNELKDVLINKRIVMVTSLTAYLSKNRALEQFDKLSKNKIYGFSKLMIAEFAAELIELGYDIALVHPGVCSTNILFNKDTGLPTAFARAGRRFLNIFTHSASKGALNTVLGGIYEDLKEKRYIKPRGLFAISGYPSLNKIPKKYYQKKIIKETEIMLSKKGDNHVISK